MTSLKWRRVGEDGRVADGHYDSWYEMVRQNYMARPVWTAWFCETGIGRSNRLAFRVNFTQARRACIDHHNLSLGKKG